MALVKCVRIRFNANLNIFDSIDPDLWCCIFRRYCNQPGDVAGMHIHASIYDYNGTCTVSSMRLSILVSPRYAAGRSPMIDNGAQ